MITAALLVTTVVVAADTSDSPVFAQVAADTGEITGVVTQFGSPFGGGATVDVYAPPIAGIDGNFTGTTVTNPDGSFTIGDLALTDFHVVVSPPAGYGLATEYYDNNYYPGLDALVPAAAPGTGTPININLDFVGTVNGIVTDATGNPLPDIDIYTHVWIENSGGIWVGDGPFATTNPDGTYTGQLPPSGPYAICASFDGEEVCNPRGFTQVTTPKEDGVLVTPGSRNTVNLQFGNPTAGTGEITGMVTTGGFALAGATVRVGGDILTMPGKASGETLTGADGSFTIGNLALADYRVTVIPPDGFTLAVEYYDNQYVPLDFTLVPAALPGTGTGITVDLDTVGTVSGSVLDADGNPVPDIDVYTHQWVEFLGGWVGDGPFATTNADGTYSGRLQPSGPYAICAGFDGETVCNPAGFTQAATPKEDGVQVTPGSRNTVNLQFGNPDAGTGEITGVVTAGGSPLEGATVRVGGSTALPGNVDGETITGADGTFSIGDLAYTDFQVIVIPPAGSGLATEYYDNHYYPGLDTLVPAAAPGTGSAISIELDPIGTVNGTVTDINGNPVPDALIFATVWLENSGGIWVGDGPLTTTNPDGTYTGQLAPSGPYAICAFLDGEQVCNPAGFTQEATPKEDGVPVSPGSVTTVDLQFGNPAGTGEIIGVVTDTAGAGVGDATVSVGAVPVAGLPGTFTGTALTEPDGSFSIGGLALTDFQVIVTPPAGSGLATEYYEDKYYPINDTLVAATNPGTALVITLDQAATVNGTITDADGNPVSGVDVFATEWLGNPINGWVFDGPIATTNPDGTYASQLPPSGYYAICARIYDPATATTEQVCNPAGFDHSITPETDGVLFTEGTVKTVDLQFGNADQDGIPDDVEDGAPNGGDGNSDRVPDSTQRNVASFVGSAGNYITLAAPAGTTLRNVTAIAVGDIATPPPAGYLFPDGLISFELDVDPGAEVEVAIISSDPTAVTGYAKFIDGAWLTLPTDQVQVLADRVIITLRDGGVGDADGIENGTIVDPGGSFSVESEFRGFRGAVKTDRINEIKSGKRINLWFSVSQGGVEVTDPSLIEISVSIIPCDSTDPADATLDDVLPSEGRSSLHGHGKTFHAQQILQGDPGTCRLVTASMTDGSGELSAIFEFTPRGKRHQARLR